ncbi:MAG: VIT domain-containing protein [Sandaracinaceae bacterium]|nr:VIT domain-containing protein [Sandaracinaceae bacterium]
MEEVAADAPRVEDDRPTEGTLRLRGAPEDGELAGFPLVGTSVDARVSGFAARVEVEQTFENPYERAIEAVYLFPLPDDAAVDGMELHTGERVVRGQIRERTEARREYRAARDRGALASLLEQERPNLFRQAVANILPGERVRVVLRYTQVLPYEAGSYRFVFPMVAGPRYTPRGEGEPVDDDRGVSQVVLAPGAERSDRVDVRISASLGARCATSPRPPTSSTWRGRATAARA